MLYSMRCGRMLPDGKLLKPDTRKGTLTVERDDQGLVHFKWCEKEAQEPEIDVVVFPGEAIFEKVARPGTRVFILKFKFDEERNLFFWAQEPHTADDDRHIMSIDVAINSEQQEEDELKVDTEMQTHQPSGNQAIGASQLAAALGSIMQQSSNAGMSLSDVLRPEVVTPILTAPEMFEKLKLYLPEEFRSPDSFASILSSPQFRHQLALLSQALATGQMDASVFGLGENASGVDGFLDAIQKQADGEKEKE